VGGSGEDVELVVQEQATFAIGEREDEALVEAAHHLLVRLCAEASVDVLQVKVHSGDIQGTFRGHSGDIQGTFRGHSGDIQGTFRGHSGNTQGTFRGQSGNIQ
jgi:hypothetical protein